MMLVSQETDVLLTLQGQKANASSRHASATKQAVVHSKQRANARHLGGAEHLVFYVAATKLFLQCGACGGIEHLLLHLQTPDRKIHCWNPGPNVFYTNLKPAYLAYFKLTVFHCSLYCFSL